MDLGGGLKPHLLEENDNGVTTVTPFLWLHHAKSLKSVVGATGIEPVTPTV